MSIARFSTAIVISHFLTFTALSGDNPNRRENTSLPGVASGFGPENQTVLPMALEINGNPSKEAEPIVVSTNAADASGRFGYAEGGGGGSGSSGSGIGSSGPLGSSGEAGGGGGGGGGGSQSNPNNASSQNTKASLNVSAAGSGQASSSATVAQVPEARDTTWLFAAGLLGLGCYLIWLRKRSEHSTPSR